MRKRYSTPHRSRVVKTRMTEEEYAEFVERLSACNMSQAEFIRQAIAGAAIRPSITVSPINDELLAAVGKLTAEYGRIGGNLNQIARKEQRNPSRIAVLFHCPGLVPRIPESSPRALFFLWHYLHARS